MKPLSVTIQIKATEQYFPVVKKKKNALFLSVNVFSTKVRIGDTIFTSPTGDGTAISTWSSEPLEGPAVWYSDDDAVQGGSNLWVCGSEILKCGHSNKAIEQYFPIMLFVKLDKVVPTFDSVNEILKCGHSNEAIEQHLKFCGTVYNELYAVQRGSNFKGDRTKT